MLTGYRTKDGRGIRVVRDGKPYTMWGCKTPGEAHDRCVRAWGPGTLDDVDGVLTWNPADAAPVPPSPTDDREADVDPAAAADDWRDPEPPRSLVDWSTPPKGDADA